MRVNRTNILGVNMSNRPSMRERSPKGITSEIGPLFFTRKTRPILLASALCLTMLASACAPSRPIAPVRPPTDAVATHRVFNADQRERLEQLHAALAEPNDPDLASGVLVRLAFDTGADLDLFVTDPQQESVYFANSPTRSGGSLLSDRRCDDPAPRVETVHFAKPMAGRYRVGVDFHGRCDDAGRLGADGIEGLYVVRVDHGGQVTKREGVGTLEQFEVIVVEFDVK